MLVLGIDAACAARNVGIAAARWDGAGCTVLGAETGKGGQPMRTLVPRLVEWMGGERRGLLAIDAPLGFPDPLRRLRDHTAGDDPPADCGVPDPFVRRTDSFVREETRKVPLAVGADRIARTALATLTLLAALRRATEQRLGLAWSPADVRGWSVIEVYPAATVAAHLDPGGARIARDADAVHGLLRCELAGMAAVDAVVRANEHARDACLAVVAAQDFLRGDPAAPGEQDAVVARREGWIWFRRPAARSA